MVTLLVSFAALVAVASNAIRHGIHVEIHVGPRDHQPDGRFRFK
jgi:hypothetical protein